MRKSLALAAAFSSMFISAAAFAAPVLPPLDSPTTERTGTAKPEIKHEVSLVDTGTIKSIHAKRNEITLADGKTYAMPGGVSAKSFKVGEKVTVTYSMKDAHELVTSVKAA